jgi:hypothetical protein
MWEGAIGNGIGVQEVAASAVLNSGPYVTAGVQVETPPLGFQASVSGGLLGNEADTLTCGVCYDAGGAISYGGYTGPDVDRIMTRNDPNWMHKSFIGGDFFAGIGAGFGFTNANRWSDWNGPATTISFGIGLGLAGVSMNYTYTGSGLRPGVYSVGVQVFGASVGFLASKYTTWGRGGGLPGTILPPSRRLVY